MKINLFVKLIKRRCWLFSKIIDPSDDITSAFCITHDNSPCIKYNHAMHGLQKEECEICLALYLVGNDMEKTEHDKTEVCCVFRVKLEPFKIYGRL